MRILLMFFLIVLTLGTTAQQNPVALPLQLDQKDYQHKSREQKTVATVCFVAGAATAAVGA